MFQFSNLQTFKLSNSQTMLFCKLYNIAKIKTSQFEKCDNGIFPRSRPASHKHIQLSQGVYMTQSQIMGENHFREYFLRTFSLVPKGRWCALQCVIECRAKCKKTLAAKSKAKQRRYVHLGGQSPRRHYCLAMRLHAPNGEANLKASRQNHRNFPFPFHRHKRKHALDNAVVQQGSNVATTTTFTLCSPMT